MGWVMFSCVATAVIVAQISGGGPPSADAPGSGVAPGEAAPVADPPATDWYGLPALVTDGAALTLVAAGLGAHHRGILLLGGAGYLVGAPINHVINRRPGRAVGSFFLRQFAAAFAVGILFVSYASQGCDSDGSVNESCELGTALLAGGVVLAGAAILDDLRIAHPRQPATRKGSSLTPSLVLAPNLGFLSLGGSF